MPVSHVEYLARHMLLLAAPAFLPAVVVVAVILSLRCATGAPGNRRLPGIGRDFGRKA